ncbi:MAG TPA: hypothetical protein DIU35_12965 [Candidatus Latescibacteria bacterium]|nr:hypothetical protein [Candidatus Latescibacterota bacterium]
MHSWSHLLCRNQIGDDYQVPCIVRHAHVVVDELDRFGTMTFEQVVQPALELVEGWQERYSGY